MAHMSLSHAPYPSSPNLWPLSVAARMENLDPRTLAKACLEGRIPVTLVALGERSRFVKADEFNAWRQGRRPSAENLFE